jgi:hypothetical protein
MTSPQRGSPGYFNYDKPKGAGKTIVFSGKVFSGKFKITEPLKIHDDVFM